MRIGYCHVCVCSRCVWVIHHSAPYCMCLYLDCWTETEDVQGIGGTPQPYIETLKECQAACLADPMCVAIDWTECSDGYKCWLLYTATTQPVGWSYGGCSHYELDRTCTGWSVVVSGLFQATINHQHLLQVSVDRSLNVTRECPVG